MSNPAKEGATSLNEDIDLSMAIPCLRPQMVQMKLESGPGSACVHIQHLFCSVTLALWTPVVSVGIKVRTPRAVALSVAFQPFEDVIFLARELIPGKMHIFPIFCIKFHGVNGLLKLLCSFQVRNSCPRGG